MELDDYFPARFPKARESQYYSKLKERTILIARDTITGSSEHEKEIETIDQFFTSLYDPKEYGKIELQVELDFEKMCHQLSEHTNRNVKKLTVKEFYTLIDVVEKKQPKTP